MTKTSISEGPADFKEQISSGKDCVIFDWSDKAFISQQLSTISQYVIGDRINNIMKRSVSVLGYNPEIWDLAKKAIDYYDYGMISLL